MYQKYFKRLLDIILSGLAIVVFSPVLLCISILVRIKLGKPVIFRQDRPGYHERIFTLYKFRTMTDRRDENGVLLPDGQRLTRFGVFLRKTSLDELPELFNIFKGDMSIVGPRPLLIEYIPYYTKKERKRHDVRPGLSGLAQICGRNSLVWEDRLEKDVQYVEKITLFGDITIIFKTIVKVFKRVDVAEDTNLTEGNFAEQRKQSIGV